MKKRTCPCCGYKTLGGDRGSYDICSICFWEDDPVQFSDVYYEGGANKVSLYQAQRNYIEFGACEFNMINYVRKPNKNDIKDCDWIIIKEYERVAEVTIDLRDIKSIKQLHSLFKEKLDFPDFYGMNWDAFNDAITGLVAMPEKLYINNWWDFQNKFPKDSRIMKEILDEAQADYPNFSSEVFYNSN